MAAAAPQLAQQRRDTLRPVEDVGLGGVTGP
jgi:hypothetical protein